MSNNNSDSESEYVRGSECARIVIKTGQCINSMRDDIINEKKKTKALDVLAKEFSDKYKDSIPHYFVTKDVTSSYKVRSLYLEKFVNTLYELV